MLTKKQRLLLAKVIMQPLGAALLIRELHRRLAVVLPSLQ
jgi:hypothetical protein